MYYFIMWRHSSVCVFVNSFASALAKKCSNAWNTLYQHILYAVQKTVFWDVLKKAVAEKNVLRKRAIKLNINHAYILHVKRYTSTKFRTQKIRKENVRRQKDRSQNVRIK
jgi:hypothetical protein